MTRREFAKCIGAVAGVAAIHGFSFANEGEKKMKCAVVYFSRSGNTRFAAETISKKAGADLFERTVSEDLINLDLVVLDN